MRLNLFILILFATAVVSPWGSADDLITRSEQCVCHEGQADVFEEPIRFGFGPFKGQCVSSCKFRRVIFLDDKQRRPYKPDRNHIVVANVLHNHQHWIARIPVNQVSEVDIGFEKFLSRISHVVLRFKFTAKSPVELYRQDEFGKKTVKIEEKLQDLVLSAEAVPPKDHPFAFFESSLGRYLLVYRMLSIDETVNWMVVEQKHAVKQYQLALENKTRENLLRAALNESAEKSFKSAYQLLTNNCATSLMSFITQEIGYKPSLYDTLGLVSWQEAIPMDAPFGTVYALSAMHLLKNSAQLPNLEEEFHTHAQSRVGGSVVHR